MGAEVLNNTLSIKKDLVVAGKVHTPTVTGRLTITGGTTAQLRLENQSGTEVYFEGSGAANISADNNLYLLAKNDGEIHFGSAGTDSELVLEDSNLGLGTETFLAASVGNLAIGNGTSPGALTADQIYIGARDSAATGTDPLSTLALFCEEAVDATALDAVGTLTTRIPIWVNDVCYWLYLDPV